MMLAKESERFYSGVPYIVQSEGAVIGTRTLVNHESARQLTCQILASSADHPLALRETADTPPELNAVAFHGSTI